MKKLLFALVLCFILFGAGVQARVLSGHSIDVIVSNSGNASITEKFFFDFNGLEELNEFKATAISLGQNAAAWKAFDPEIFSSLGSSESDGENKTFSFEEKGSQKYVRLSYPAQKLFSEQASGQKNYFSLDKTKMYGFHSDGILVIPENTIISFALPVGAEISYPISPEALSENNKVTWNGFISSNVVELTFSLPKPFQQPQITGTEIQIEVDEKGYASLVKEFYYLSFESQDELNYFRDLASKNGSTLSVWTASNQKIFAHMGEKDTEISSAAVSFIEDGLKKSYIRLVYSLDNPIFSRQSEAPGRLVKWTLNQKEFSKFQSGSTIIIPEKTKIIFSFPINAEIILPVRPQGIVLDKRVVWQGYTSDNRLELGYTLEKNIAPAFDTAKFALELMGAPYKFLVLAAIIVVGAILYFYRKKISKEIENYIVKNSSLESKEEVQEELELE
ncbi:MAG: hypothetical protein AB1467_00855 [Candidatus Diapherotrites archaeon]